MRRLEVLGAVEKRWDGCERCRLAKTRNRVVHWRGNPEARLFVIGEAPGVDEDREGRPFVGAAGQLLDELFRAAGLKSSEDAFIANRLGCRPPANRLPERDELRACSQRLSQLLRLVRPKAILLVGATAGKLAGVNGVLQHRGRELEVEIVGERESGVWPAFVTYHPSFLLRSGAHSPLYSHFREVVSDIQRAWAKATEVRE